MLIVACGVVFLMALDAERKGRGSASSTSSSSSTYSFTMPTMPPSEDLGAAPIVAWGMERSASKDD